MERFDLLQILFLALEDSRIKDGLGDSKAHTLEPFRPWGAFWGVGLDYPPKRPPALCSSQEYLYPMVPFLRFHCLFLCFPRISCVSKHSQGTKIEHKFFFLKLFGHLRDIPPKSWDIPPKKFDFPGFEGHTELFGPHPFTWKTPTPPENIWTKMFGFGFLFCP